MKNKILVLTIFFIASISLLSTDRKKKVINEDWLFYKGYQETGYEHNLVTSGWKEVDLPHTWNVWDSFDIRVEEDSLFDVADYYYRGPGWYRKTLFIPAKDKGKRIFIEFEAANVMADLWVNEKHLGQHIGGYSGFKFDITDQVNFGEENLIAVLVDNSFHYDIPPHRADYTMYGGIYRDVYLVKTNPNYIDRVLISTPDVSQDEGEVTVKALLYNKADSDFSGEIEFDIADPNGDVISSQDFNVSLEKNSSKEFEFQLQDIKSPELWSPESPNIYKLKSTLLAGDKKLDQVGDHFGLRWYRFDGKEGFFLNGEYLKLHGVNRHQDRDGYGNALPNELHREDIRMIKDIGANFLRLAHYQQDPIVLNMCDSLGILVWEEIPVITSVGEDEFLKNAKSMLHEMIIQHYNHPSVIIWGLMNETVRNQPDDRLYINVNMCKELSELADSLDPARYTTQAQMRARGEDIHKYTDIRAWNKYFGWYYDEFEDFGPFMDKEHSKDPNQPFIISEYGAGSKLGYHVENPAEPDFSEEWALEFHQSHWEQIKARRWIAGSTVWNMFDFGSDEKAGNIPHINQKGLVSFDRKPKDVFYYYQSEWSDEPMIYIRSHTWTEREGSKEENKELEILSNCDSVQLILNDENLGSKKSKPYVWDVQYEEGINTIKALGTKDGDKVYDELEINYRIVE